jgi:plastocyanin
MARLAAAGLAVAVLCVGGAARAEAIKGSVAFTGKAPAMPPLNRGGDPFCAKEKMNDEEVLVNKNGTLKNVIVRVIKGAAPSKAPAEPVHVDQQSCMYRPRVSGVVEGQKLLIKNGDKTLHNVHTYLGGKTMFNKAQPPIATMPPIEWVSKSPEQGILKFKCDVHPWMTAYVSITQNAFFAVTGDDGSFELKDVPPGTYTVEAWQERYGSKTMEVTVAAGKPGEAKFSYTGSEEKPKM